jgi:hypothetical protein
MIPHETALRLRRPFATGNDGTARKTLAYLGGGAQPAGDFSNGLSRT